MSISFTYCGVACGVISIDNQFFIGIDPDLSPKGTSVQFKGFVSEKQTDVYKDESLPVSYTHLTLPTTERV